MDTNETGNEGDSKFREFVPKIRKTKAISLSSATPEYNMALETETKPEKMPRISKNFENKTAATETSICIPVDETQHKDTSETLTMQTKEKFPLEATFTHPNDLLENAQRSPKKTAYQALQFASATNSTTYEGSGSVIGEDKHLTAKILQKDESVAEALLAFILAVFGPMWSLGMAYLHLSLRDNLQAAIATISVVGFFVVVLHIAYFAAKKSPKKQIWEKNKLVWFLCLIPGLPATVLSFCNFVFAMKESQSRSYERPWTKTRYLFLVQSLALAFTQTVLHLVILVEDPVSCHTYAGYAMLVGAVVFSFDITFSRFRYDSQYKSDGFGVSFEKYVRLVCLWANKWLWLVTCTLTILCFRMVFPSHPTATLCTAIAVIFAVHELPLVFLLCPLVQRKSSNILGGLMMIPQFYSLIVLIIWINVDPNVYAMDTSSMVLGIFFYAEIVILTGWLYDRCTGREIEFTAFYPHFFADICTNIGH